MSVKHLVNANIHRMKEGARVLEDIARFILREEELFQKARTIRHALINTQPTIDIERDLGGVGFCEDNVRANMLHTVQANAVRMQEALRVLEEFSDTSKDEIKSLRYQSYTLQQLFYHATVRFMQTHKLQGIYPVIDTDVIQSSLFGMIDQINRSAVSVVQYRNKHASKRQFMSECEHVRSLLADHILLIINDHLDVAIDLADGVHVGQADYPVERIRHIVPDHFIIGVTCHNLQEAKMAVSNGASYISVGCLYPTKSKRDIVPTSLATLTQIVEASSVPVCGIGGINPENVQQVWDCHVAMIATVSAIEPLLHVELT